MTDANIEYVLSDIQALLRQLISDTQEVRDGVRATVDSIDGLGKILDDRIAHLATVLEKTSTK